MLDCKLSIIARGSEIFMSRCLADFGITASEVIILTYLYENENPRQEDIARYLMLDKGSVAKTLKKLEGKNIICRQVNEEDQREKLIRLTEEGYCVKDVCLNMIQMWRETMFKGLSAQDAAAFERIVGDVSANVMSSLEKWGLQNEHA